MKVNVNSVAEFTPEALATALFNSDPGTFAKFWFEFSKLIDSGERGKDTLEKFAIAMAPGSGARRKNVLKRMVELITYHEEIAARETKGSS